MSKPDPIAKLGKFTLLPPYGKYASYRIEWFVKSSRQTEGISTRTTNRQDAEKAFNQHCLMQSTEQLKDEPLLNSCNRYHLKYGHTLPSADVFLQAQAAAMEVLTDPANGDFGPMVSQMGVANQKKLIEAWQAKGMADSTILRWLGCLWAAMNFAAEGEHINPTVVPKRYSAKRWKPHLKKRTKVLSPVQLAALLDAACLVSTERPEMYLIEPRGKYTYYRVGLTGLNTQRTSRRSLGTSDLETARARLREYEAKYHADHPVTATVTYGVQFRLVLSLIATAAREAALRDLIVTQIDFTHGVMDLNPEGRKQTKKFRPIIPMAPTFQEWLRDWSPMTPEGHLLGAKDMRLLKDHSFFEALARRTGVKCTPYTIRHTVSTWMASRVESPWERDQFMGWMRSEGSAMSANYNHYDPRYLRGAAAAVQSLLEAIAQHMVGDLLRRGVDDQPAPPDDQAMAWIDARLANGFSRWVADVTPTPLPVSSVLVGTGGFEPPTPCLSSKCSTPELRAQNCDPNPSSGCSATTPAWRLRGGESDDLSKNQALIVPPANDVKV